MRSTSLNQRHIAQAAAVRFLPPNQLVTIEQLRMQPHRAAHHAHSILRAHFKRRRCRFQCSQSIRCQRNIPPIPVPKRSAHRDTIGPRRNRARIQRLAPQQGACTKRPRHNRTAIDLLPPVSQRSGPERRHLQRHASRHKFHRRRHPDPRRLKHLQLSAGANRAADFLPAFGVPNLHVVPRRIQQLRIRN